MKSLKERRRVKVLRELGIALAIGATAYCYFTESGPYRWLVTFQAEHLFKGSFYPKITIFLVLLIFAIPGFLLEDVIMSVTKTERKE